MNELHESTDEFLDRTEEIANSPLPKPSEARQKLEKAMDENAEFLKRTEDIAKV